MASSPDLPGVMEHYEQNVLSWLKSKVGDGMALLRREPAFNELENSLKYVSGEQFPLRSKSISRVVDNRLRKIVQETVGALTDVRPIWNYDTNDPKYKEQAIILNKLARSWWKNALADRKLQSTLTWSCVGGSGYAYLRWNADKGDFELIPIDPRNLIPIEPAITDSIQDWMGMIIRQNQPITAAQQEYPLQAHKLARSRGSWFEPTGVTGTGIFNVITAAWTSVTRGYEGKTKTLPDTVDIFHCFFKDASIHTGLEPQVMGDPNSNYSYTVYPIGSVMPDGRVATEKEARLYPRGRYIIASEYAVIHDGPNPYWHGLFPVVRFTLDPLPWSILGASMVGDLISLQNSLNECLRGIDDGMGQWIRRGIIADRQSLSKATLDNIDTRKAGMKAYLNNNIGGEGFRVVDGPQLPGWYVNMLQYFKDEMDDLSGVRNLQQMAQLKQMPSADTLERYQESLSHVLKLRARSMEVSLGELAEMLKVGFFQCYDVKRRVTILGAEGVVLEDFDYDPGVMIPSELDGADRTERAMNHHKNFKFNVAPNTFLNVSHTEQKMLVMQMFGRNIMDPWSLWEAMDITNAGPPPAETITDRLVAAKQLGLMEGSTPDIVQLQNLLTKLQIQQQIQQMQMQMGMMQAGTGAGAPGTEVPSNNGVGPQGGRPPSAQEPPQMVQKPGEGRQTVSESGR